VPDLRGQRPRPRVCVVGAWSSEERAGLEALFQSLTFHDHVGDMFETWAPPEIDVAVIGETTADLERRASETPRGAGPVPAADVSRLNGTHLILFGTPVVRNVPFHHGRSVHAGTLAASAEHTVLDPLGHVSRVLRAAMGAVADVRRWTTLCLQPQAPLSSGTYGPSDRERLDFQLAAGAEGVFQAAALVSAAIPAAPLAVATIRADTGKGFGWLPNFRDHRVAWVEALVHDWAAHDRVGLAAIPPWGEQRAWRTAEEVAVLEELDVLRRQRALAIAGFDRQVAELEERLCERARSADRFERGLLTTKGVDLVAFVVRVLTDLGFAVRDMDAEKTPGEPKLEDLRVTHRRRPGWEALVEVKGHEKRGLALTDVNQARRPRDRYRDQSRRWPDRVLFIVNGEAGKPPSARSEPFATDPEQVRAIEAEEFWLIVPTTALFWLYRDRRLLADRAADLLMDSWGVFRYRGDGP
jgi:hypothetical protein